MSLKDYFSCRMDRKFLLDMLFLMHKRLSKIHITLLLRVLSASFCLFFGHVATATLPHHKQKSIRQSFSKSVSYKFRQSLRASRIYPGTGVIPFSIQKWRYVSIASLAVWALHPSRVFIMSVICGCISSIMSLEKQYSSVSQSILGNAFSKDSFIHHLNRIEYLMISSM